MSSIENKFELFQRSTSTLRVFPGQIHFRKRQPSTERVPNTTRRNELSKSLNRPLRKKHFKPSVNILVKRRQLQSTRHTEKTHLLLHKSDVWKQTISTLPICHVHDM